LTSKPGITDNKFTTQKFTLFTITSADTANPVAPALHPLDFLQPTDQV